MLCDDSGTITKKFVAFDFAIDLSGKELALLLKDMLKNCGFTLQLHIVPLGNIQSILIQV